MYFVVILFFGHDSQRKKIYLWTLLRSAKTQISLNIREVWSEILLTANSTQQRV